jgi:hypothetical protein
MKSVRATAIPVAGFAVFLAPAYAAEGNPSRGQRAFGTCGRSVLLAMILLCASLACTDATKVQSQPSDEAIWQHFLEWLPGTPPVDGPNIFFDQYRSRLAAGDATAAEVDRELCIVRRLHRERPDASDDLWSLAVSRTASAIMPKIWGPKSGVPKIHQRGDAFGKI